MHNKRIVRQMMIALALVMAMSVLAACGSVSSSGGSAEQLKLKIADISTNPIFRVAKTKGFFEQNGIDAELITFATPAEGINSLFIKQVDVAFGADFPLLNAASKGDYRIFASTGTATDLSARDWKLIVNKDITSPADLKGKSLSFSRGTFIPYLWDVYLNEHALSLDDVTLVGQGGFDESYVALRKGEIDAVWIVNAVNHEKFLALDSVHELTDMSQTPVRIGGGLIATNELLIEQHEAMVGFLRALDQASRFTQENPEETAQILYDEVKLPKEVTLKDLQSNPWEIGFTERAYEGLQGQKDYMIGEGIIENPFELNDKLNLDLVREAFPDRVIDLE